MIRFKDDKEAAAWDLYVAGIIATNSTVIKEAITAEADAVLEERRKRAWNFCHTCQTATQWYEIATGRRCADCGTEEKTP